MNHARLSSTSLVNPSTGLPLIKADHPQQLKSVTVYWRGRKMVLMQRPQRRLSVLLCRMLRRSWQVLFGAMTVAALTTGAARAGITDVTLPTGGVVQSGTATIGTAVNNQLTINQSTNKAIIDWQSFSIGKSASVNFVLPDANASTLNRVVGNDPSLIMGSLTSNGKLFLINQAGILVGKDAKVNVASFVASTLNISNDDFLANRLNFAADAGKTPGNVKNKGEITVKDGGSVYLIGANVENDGIIKAPNGEILLAAGRVVKLIDVNLPGVSIDVGGIKGKVTNLGQIMASAGTIGISAGLIKNSGTISASSVEKQGGRIFLRASDTLTTTATSDINANGTTGGNVVLYSDAGADIDGSVSALGSAGNGGYVDTSGKQSLSVKYVPKIGPGGEWYIDPYNVEIVADATPETAISGSPAILATGSSATIHASTISTLLSAGTSVTVATGGTGSPGADAGDITVNAAITKTGTTAASLTLNAANNININQTISDGSTAGNNGGLTLALNAGYSGAGATGTPTSTGTIAVTGADITVGAGLVSKSNVFNYVGASNSMNLYGASSIANTFSLTGGTINLNGATTFGSIVPNSGTFNVKAATAANFINIAGSAAFNLSAALSTNTLIMQAGTITSVAPSTLTVNTTLTHTGGVMSLDAGVFTQLTGDLSLGSVSANSLTLTANAGKIVQTQAVTATNLSATAVGGITLDNASNQIAQLTATNTTSGLITLRTNGSVSLGAITNSPAGVSVTSNTGSITQTAAINANTLATSAATGITLTNTNNNLQSFSAQNSTSGNVDLINGGTQALSLGVLSNANGNISVNTGASLIATSAITTNNAASLTTHGSMTIGANGINAHDINLTTVATGGSEAITINGQLVAPGTVTLNSANAIGGSSGITTAALNAIASNNISLNGSTNHIQNITATSGLGGVSLVNIGALTLGNISSTNGNVELTSSGAITQASGGITTNQNLIVSSAGGATFNSATNNVAGFQATNTGSGNISLTNTSEALALNGSVRNLASSGNVTIVNDGNIAGTVNRDGGGAIINTTSADGLLTLTSNNGNVALGPVTATNLTVNATSGAISETSYGMAVVSGTMTANAANGISLPSNSCGTNRIANFVATNTGTGDITLGNGNTGGVTSKLVNISNAYGDVTVTNIGALQTVSGGTISGQNVSLSTVQNNATPTTTTLVLNGQLTAVATVALTSAESAITQNGGGISAALLTTNAVQGVSLTAGTNAVAAFNASNQSATRTDGSGIVINAAGNVALLAHTAGAPAKLDVNVASNANGSISIENYGAMETHEQVFATNGSVTLTTHSPLTIGGGGVTASTGVTLTAGNIAAATAADNMIVNGAVTTSGGNVALVAGNTMVLNALVSAPAGTVSLTAGVNPVQNTPTAPSPIIQIGAGVVLPPPADTPTGNSVVNDAIKNTTGQTDLSVHSITTVQNLPQTLSTTALQTQTTNTTQTIGGGDGEFGGSTDGASGSGGSSTAKAPAKTMFCS